MYLGPDRNVCEIHEATRGVGITAKLSYCLAAVHTHLRPLRHFVSLPQPSQVESATGC